MSYKSLRPVRWGLGISGFLSSVGIALWIFVDKYANLLPSPTSKAGRQLLRQYQGTTADIFLGFTIATIAYLAFKILSGRKEYNSATTNTYPRRRESIADFAKNQPVTLAIMTGYLIAMVVGTTHLYKDLIGWYPSLIENNLLDNFSIRSSFISETFRRTDFRFFPLAHQDLHILSWFTIHIKVWMIFAGAQLFAIIILATRLVERLTGFFPKKAPGLLLSMTLLILFHPSTGNTFFQVIYCERTLVFLSLAYYHCILEHRETKSATSFSKALLIATIGIFTKDIAVILFMTPPALQIGSNLIKSKLKIKSNFLKESTPEVTLLCLIPVFITCFIYIALIPSTYADKGAYSNPADFTFNADARIFALISILALKIGKINKELCELDLLDQINISAIVYAIALGFLAKYDSSDYLTFPVQAIIATNIGWAWARYQAKRITQKNLVKSTELNLGAFAALALIIVEQFTITPSFGSIVHDMKKNQISTEATYSALFPIARDLREKGDEVNVIIHRSSRLSYHRHLYKVPYDRLVEYYPKTGEYWIKDGHDKGKLFTPSAGDLAVNIDKEIDILNPIFEGKLYEVLYRHNPTRESGIITRLE